MLTSANTRARATLREPCEITARDYDVTPKVEEALANGLRSGIDDTITNSVAQQSALKKGVEALWQTLNTPVGPGGGRLWIAVKPEQMLVGPIDGDGETLRTRIGVRARPEISLEQPAAPNPIPPLPPASTGAFDDHSSATVQLTSAVYRAEPAPR